MKKEVRILKFAALIFVCVSSPLLCQQYPGYTLYSVKNSTTSELIDTNGTVFHSWTHATTAKTMYSSYLMPGGILWRAIGHSPVSFTGGPISGEVQKVDYNGNVLWDFVYSSTLYVTHHDICPLPNGNVLLIAYEVKTAAEVASAGCTAFSGIMWPDKIIEVQPTGATTGTIVWEWHEWDHLVQNTNASATNYQTSIVNHPELLNINYNASKDWSHMNGVGYNPILDQITFSSHNLSEIYVIDHSTTTAQAASHAGGNSGKGGDILYRWGNPAAYGAVGTKILNVVHDAHWIPEGVPNAGSLVGYNNGGISGPTGSCVDQVVPPISGYNYTITPGLAYTPATYNSRQASGGYNTNEGGSQQLPNGNTLLSMGISGYLKEFSATGTLLWSKTLTGGCAKVFRYSNCYINNAAPAIPVISALGSQLGSTLATTYQWYLNGVLISGATNQTYNATIGGIYVVRITDSNGCVFQYSQGFNYLVSTTNTNENKLSDNIKIYPNPTSGIVKLEVTNFYAVNYEIIVFDLLGNIILKEKNPSTINISSYDGGIYLLTILTENGDTFTKKISLIK